MDIKRTHTAGSSASNRSPLSGLAVAIVLIFAAVGVGTYALNTTDLAASLTEPVGQGEPIAPAGREALADSRGDPAANGAFSTDPRKDFGDQPDVEAVGRVDNRTRDAVEEASRGDAAAQGSVSDDDSATEVR